MRLPDFILQPLKKRLISYAASREADVYIGGKENPYLIRWHVIPRNKWLNIYLHHFMRSDDDRALHSHPWSNISILLDGCYIEHLPGYIRKFRREGFLYGRGPSCYHRVELLPSCLSSKPGVRDVWTLFITGPKVREWFFACSQGKVHWKDFTSENGNEVGKGCNQ